MGNRGIRSRVHLAHPVRLSMEEARELPDPPELPDPLGLLVLLELLDPPALQVKMASPDPPEPLEKPLIPAQLAPRVARLDVLGLLDQTTALRPLPQPIKP